jgi:hypothetical protein
MVYFANLQHLTLCQTYFIAQPNKMSHVFHTCAVPHHRNCEGWWSDPFHGSHLRVWLWVVVSLRVSYVCIPRVDHARQGYTPFKRRVSKVGRCPCSGLTHGYRFYKRTVLYVDAFVTCWHERFVFCRYTNHARKSLSANRIAPTSYYKESRL